MGWDFHHEVAPYNRREILKKELNTEKYEVLKDALVGSVWYAAIRNKETGNVYAAVVLTKIHKNDYCNFGIKWMDDSVGPYYYDCPKNILDLLSPTDSEWANEWRKKCLENKAKKKEKDILKTSPIGTKFKVELTNGDTREVIKMAPNRQFKTWWLFAHASGTYVGKKYVAKAEIIA